AIFPQCFSGKGDPPMPIGNRVGPWVSREQHPSPAEVAAGHSRDESFSPEGPMVFPKAGCPPMRIGKLVVPGQAESSILLLRRERLAIQATIRFPPRGPWFSRKRDALQCELGSSSSLDKPRAASFSCGGSG